jgi:hypothetical protein
LISRGLNEDPIAKPLKNPNKPHGKRNGKNILLTPNLNIFLFNAIFKIFAL